MKFIKQVREITRNAKKVSNVKKVLERIRIQIEDAATKGESSLDLRHIIRIERNKFLTNPEIGRVIGTLKRQGFKVKEEIDFIDGWASYWSVSWK